LTQYGNDKFTELMSRNKLTKLSLKTRRLRY